ncbi:hypothetical protein C2I36_07985 [Rhodobacteraceae bacterium WD3A24]|nr:hypothetical protein C2I36_07985 [Rhodobacteraceae bacterium WD3A24]
MKGQPTISPIYREGAPSADPDPIDAWGRVKALRRRAWRNAGVISVRPDELPEPLAGLLWQWAEEHYGSG